MQMKDVKARDVSLAVKIGAVAIMVGGTVLVGLGVLNLEVSEVLWLGFAVAGVFGTVDLNLMLEKFSRK